MLHNVSFLNSFATPFDLAFAPEAAPSPSRKVETDLITLVYDRQVCGIGDGGSVRFCFCSTREFGTRS